MKVREMFFRRDRTGAQWGRHLRPHAQTRTLCGRSVLWEDRWTRRRPEGTVHDCARCQAAARDGGAEIVKVRHAPAR